MQLGFVSAALAEQSLADVLAFAARERFSAVELLCWPVGRAERRFAGVTHIDVTSLTPERADEIRAECAAHGIAISGLGFYPNMLDPDPAVAQAAVTHFRAVIAAASLLGVQTVNGFVGRDWTRTVDENWPRFLETWRPIVRHAEEHGVRIGIENCPMLFTRDEWPGGKNLFTTPAVWRRAFNDIGSASFGLNYDPSSCSRTSTRSARWPSSGIGSSTCTPRTCGSIGLRWRRWGDSTFRSAGTSPGFPATARSNGSASWAS
jgi:sugar phosphate isomerase/epimerase